MILKIKNRLYINIFSIIRNSTLLIINSHVLTTIMILKKLYASLYSPKNTYALLFELDQSYKERFAQGTISGRRRRDIFTKITQTRPDTQSLQPMPITYKFRSKLPNQTDTNYSSLVVKNLLIKYLSALDKTILSLKKL